MNGWDGAVLTALLAVVIFVVGQAILRFVLEPIQEQKRLLGEVAHALLFYANRGSMGVALGTYAPEDVRDASRHLRDLAGRLRSSIFFVPRYDALARLGWVPPRKNVLDAATELVGWSNGVLSERSGSDNLARRSLIAEKLGIDRLMDVG